MILTEAERNAIEDECEMTIGKLAFDAIEAAVIARLATVSVGPVGEVSGNAEVSGLSTRPPGYRAGTELGEK